MSPTVAAERRHALILTAGQFGAMVADRLRGPHDRIGPYEVTVQDIDGGTHPALWPRTDLLVLAAGHDRPRVTEAIDARAFDWNMPWLEVCAEPTSVRVGPVVIPGRTACYRCFRNRRDQHRPQDLAAPLSGDGRPSGFAVHHVGIAAALARQAIAEVSAQPDRPGLGGTVRSFHLVTGVTSKSTVVAGDRCPRCRQRPGSEGLWRRLAQATEGVLA